MAACSFSSGPTLKGVRLVTEVAALSVVTCDVNQTYKVAREGYIDVAALKQYRENNPFLGPNPNPKILLGVLTMDSTAIAAYNYLLPVRASIIINLLVVAVESMVIVNNNRDLPGVCGL